MLRPTFSRQLGLSSRCTARSNIRSSVLLRFKTTSAKKPVVEEVQKLSWPDYLAIRGSKRKWQMAVTIPCALLGFFGGATYFGSLETDPAKPIMVRHQPSPTFLKYHDVKYRALILSSSTEHALLAVSWLRDQGKYKRKALLPEE
ncbi:hypothetical protein DXG01_013484 [Tephrocybe rancida]|nr:hypothetical protein DXG01_013484 [Tephrocybe rancida]